MGSYLSIEEIQRKTKRAFLAKPKQAVHTKTSRHVEKRTGRQRIRGLYEETIIQQSLQRSDGLRSGSA